MVRDSLNLPSSSRNSGSVYSLQTLSRPSSLRHHPNSAIEATAPPRARQATEEAQNRDQVLPQDVDRYDRIWGDMATRMGDLDTISSRPATDMRLVSEAHAKCVEHLRESQIRLAETWAGSESRLGSNQSSLLAKLANSAAGCELF